MKKGDLRRKRTETIFIVPSEQLGAVLFNGLKSAQKYCKRNGISYDEIRKEELI